MRTLKIALVGLALGVAACSDVLQVDNTNNPDRGRALARPSDVEALIGSSYQAIHNANLGGANDDIETQAIVMGLESFSNLANFDMGPRAAIPRSTVDNSRNNPGNVGNYRDFLNLHRAARQAATGLAAVNAPGFTFFPTNLAQTARARAMAHFCIGVALGNIALIYDQGSMISPSDNLSNPAPLPLVRYDTLMTYAINELDSAVLIGGAASAAGAFPLTSTQNWFGNPGLAMTQAQFVAFAQGYKARFWAGVARTPADRAAVPWDSVIANANAFVAAWPTGVNLAMNPSNGWDIAWIPQMYASNSNAWHMNWMFIMGMADTSGGYATWINQQSSAKQPFLVVTPDKRFPPGIDRPHQQNCNTANPCQGVPSSQPMPNGVYFRNRTASDWSGDPYANSWYDSERFAAFFAASRIGNFPIFTVTEGRMLAAEGYIQKGLFDQAAPLINVTRTANGLAALPASGNTLAAPVPGGNACVPKVPTITGNGVGTVACGNIMEALKWEKRMETQFTGPYAWFTDARGWGDLPVGTATEWPIPYQEVDTRQLFPNPPPYVLSFGGAGGTNAATTNTYGLQ